MMLDQIGLKPRYGNNSKLWLAALTAAILSNSGTAWAGLTINPTFGSSITSDSNAAAIEAAITTATQAYGQHFSDPITVNIDFQEMSTGLGQSSTWITTTSYSNFRSHLASDASTANDTTALANLPTSSTEPTNGGSSIDVSTANYRALGLGAISTPDGFDGTISINTGLTDIGNPGVGQYSLLAVVEHEIDEVLGLGSNVGRSNTIRPLDLFRYTSSGTRAYTTVGDDAWFSINGGSTLLARFNQNSGGDYGDWWSTGAHTPQVQDAFSTPGAYPTLGTNELIALDVIGYNQINAVLEPSTLSLFSVGAVWLATRRRAVRKQIS